MKTMKLTKLIITALCAAMLSACTGSDDSYTPTVNASGGTGTNGYGGNGGSVNIESYGAIKVLKSGTVDTSFTMPAASSYDFGPNPYTVKGNESIILDSTIPAGYTGLYMVLDDRNLYKADGVGGSTVVTGLKVPSGTTLTISGDNDINSPSGAYLEFTYDIVIEGTLKTGAGYNTIYFTNNSITSSAKQVFDGRSLNDNIIVVSGTVTTSGEDLGRIQFDAGKHFYNSGMLDTSCASNASGDGNSSMGIWIHAHTGSVYSKGVMKALGGNSGNGSGGYGGMIIMASGYNNDSSVDPVNGGNVVVSGLYQTNGGNAGGSGGSGGGGGGQGAMYFNSNGGDMLAYGRFEAMGGNGVGTFTGPAKAAARPSAFDGGRGEYIQFSCRAKDYRPVGVCKIAGSFDLSGGKGENGGSGGTLNVNSRANSTGVAADVQLLGFSDILLDGGNGTTGGGSALGPAYSLITNSPYNGSIYLTAGPIVSEANVYARGGNASAAGAVPIAKTAALDLPVVRGGNGGMIAIQVDPNDDYSDSASTTITQSGTINNSGGNATNTNGIGGNSYEITMYGSHVTTTGQLTSRGGNGAAIGGNGGNISLLSWDIPTSYTPANLVVKGGTGATIGLDGHIYVDDF